MNHLWTTLAVLAIIGGIAVSIVMLVILMLCAPNSSAAQEMVLKRSMYLVLAAGAIAVVGGVWALIAGRAGISMGLSATPVVVGAGVLVYLFLAGG